MARKRHDYGYAPCWHQPEPLLLHCGAQTMTCLSQSSWKDPSWPQQDWVCVGKTEQPGQVTVLHLSAKRRLNMIKKANIGFEIHTPGKSTELILRFHFCLKEGKPDSSGTETSCSPSSPPSLMQNKKLRVCILISFCNAGRRRNHEEGPTIRSIIYHRNGESVWCEMLREASHQFCQATKSSTALISWSKNRPHLLTSRLILPTQPLASFKQEAVTQFFKALTHRMRFCKQKIEYFHTEHGY